MYVYVCIFTYRFIYLSIYIGDILTAPASESLAHQSLTVRLFSEKKKTFEWAYIYIHIYLSIYLLIYIYIGMYIYSQTAYTQRGHEHARRRN